MSSDILSTKSTRIKSINVPNRVYILTSEYQASSIPDALSPWIRYVVIREDGHDDCFPRSINSRDGDFVADFFESAAAWLFRLDRPLEWHEHYALGLDGFEVDPAQVEAYLKVARHKTKRTFVRLTPCGTAPVRSTADKSNDKRWRELTTSDIPDCAELAYFFMSSGSTTLDHVLRVATIQDIVAGRRPVDSTRQVADRDPLQTLFGVHSTSSSKYHSNSTLWTQALQAYRATLEMMKAKERAANRAFWLQKDRARIAENPSEYTVV